MKQLKFIICITLFLFHSIASSGLQLHFHFCKGSIKSIYTHILAGDSCCEKHNYGELPLSNSCSSPLSNDQAPCSKGSCCDDRSLSFDTEHIHPIYNKMGETSTQYPIAFQKIYNLWNTLLTPYVIKNLFPYIEAPPPLAHSRIYLIYCNLLFYQ